MAPVVPLPVQGYFTCAAATGVFSYHNTASLVFYSLAILSLMVEKLYNAIATVL